MIREAALDDAEEICRICSDDLGYDCKEDYVKTRLTHLNRDRECIFVAEVEQKIIGFIHVERYELLYLPVMANILGLAVSSLVRRQGVGTKLIDEAKQWAAQNDISTMRLNSGKARTEAHEFYRRNGFDHEKEQIRFTAKI